MRAQPHEGRAAVSRKYPKTLWHDLGQILALSLAVAVVLLVLQKLLDCL